jgi:hypothetical protein
MLHQNCVRADLSAVNDCILRFNCNRQPLTGSAKRLRSISSLDHINENGDHMCSVTAWSHLLDQRR